MVGLGGYCPVVFVVDDGAGRSVLEDIWLDVFVDKRLVDVLKLQGPGYWFVALILFFINCLWLWLKLSCWNLKGCKRWVRGRGKFLGVEIRPGFCWLRLLCLVNIARFLWICFLLFDTYLLKFKSPISFFITIVVPPPDELLGYLYLEKQAR